MFDNYTSCDIDSIQSSIVRHLEYTLAKNRYTFCQKHCY